MKLSKLKAPQMVSVAVKDGHDSFFKKTFVISLSQKKKKQYLLGAGTRVHLGPAFGGSQGIPSRLERVLEHIITNQKFCFLFR